MSRGFRGTTLVQRGVGLVAEIEMVKCSLFSHSKFGNYCRAIGLEFGDERSWSCLY